MIFSLGDELYGFPLEGVLEVSRPRRITPIPKLPSFLRGVFALRGEVVPAVDLCLLLEIPREAKPDESWIVIAGDEEMKVGFLVRGVEDIVEAEELREPPANLPRILSEFLLGEIEWEGRPVGVLDLRKLLGSRRLRGE